MCHCLTGTGRWHNVAQCGFDPAVSDSKGNSVVKETAIKWYLVTHSDTCATWPAVIFLLYIFVCMCVCLGHCNEAEMLSQDCCNNPLALHAGGGC